jgi:hypothetical protein
MFKITNAMLLIVTTFRNSVLDKNLLNKEMIKKKKERKREKQSSIQCNTLVSQDF